MTESIRLLEKLYRKALTWGFVMGLCVLFGLFLTIVLGGSGILLVLIGVVVFFLFYRPAKTAYSNIVTQTNLENTLCRLLNAPSPSPVGSKYLDLSTLQDSGLFPKESRKTAPLFCWEMHGKRKGLTLTLCDLTDIQQYKNASGRKVINTSSGAFAVFDLSRDTGRHFLLMEMQFMPAAEREALMAEQPQYELTPLTDNDLSDAFYFYTSKDDPDHTLPAAFVQNLKRLTKFTPGYTGASVQGSKVYIFLQGRFVSQESSIRKQPTETDLTSDVFPEFSYIINLASSLLGITASGQDKTGTDTTEQSKNVSYGDNPSEEE